MQSEEVFDDELNDATDELPPLEHFLDPLPPIADFTSDRGDPFDQQKSGFPQSAAAGESRPPTGETDWAETDWQRYDWQSAAALGETERTRDEASNAWATTDWEIPSHRRGERGQSAADAIATALDQIAEKIRSGDLSLPMPAAVPDPATVAATVAALLGVRR